MNAQKAGHATWLAMFALLCPIALFATWEFLNRLSPISDAGDHFRIAVQIHDAFAQGPHQGLSFFVRTGGKPILFSVFAAPLVGLYDANPVLPSAIFLTFTFAAVVAAHYWLFRTKLKPLDAALMVILLVTLPGVFRKHMYFMPETVWHLWFILFLCAGWTSRGFSRLRPSIAAGLFLSLAILARPIESMVILAAPLAVFIVATAPDRKSRLCWVLSVAVCISAIATAALASLHQFNARIGGGVGLLACFALWFLPRALNPKPVDPNLLEIAGHAALEIPRAFLVAPTLLCSTWFGYYFYGLALWAQDNSFGTGATVNDQQYAALGLFSVFWNVIRGYGLVQILALMAIAACAAVAFKKNYFLERKREVLTWTLVLVAFLLPMLIAYQMTGTSDSRRIFLAIVYSLVCFGFWYGELKLRWPRVGKGVALALIVLIAVDIATISDATFFGARHEWANVEIDRLFVGDGVPAPQLDRSTERDVLEKIHSLGVSNARIAVFSLGLFTTHVNYETESLRTAALRYDPTLDFRTMWAYANYEPYAAAVARLRTQNFQYVLLEDLDDPFLGLPSDAQHRSHTFFVHDVLQMMKDGGVASLAGLTLVEKFETGSDQSFLFKVVN